MNKKTPIILMLFFQIGQGFSFNLVGTMNFGWILALIYTCLYLFSSPLLRYKEFRYLSILYLLLILFQILAEYMSGNSMQNGLKGIAVDIISYASFFFLLSLFMKDRRLVVWAFIGIVTRMLIFGTESESTAEEALSGENAAFLKFYLGPIILYCFLLMSVFFKGKLFTYIFMYLGLFFIVSGARSLGLITFMIGFFVWLVRFKRKDITKMLKKYALIFVALFYGLYCLYVSNVMDGTISAGNNIQLKASTNPYNPTEIIKLSRTDSWMAFSAFCDKPLWGYGSWSQDNGYNYHYLMANLKNEVFNDRSVGSGLIPGHSVIFGKGAYNGIFVMLITIGIIFFFLKRGFLLLNVDSKYTFILMYFFYSLVWHSLFSPVGHLRDTFPLYFAFIFVMWLHRNNNINYE